MGSWRKAYAGTRARAADPAGRAVASRATLSAEAGAGVEARVAAVDVVPQALRQLVPGDEVAVVEGVPRTGPADRHRVEIPAQVRRPQRPQRGAVPHLRDALPPQIAEHVLALVDVRAGNHGAVPEHR